jgi:hypothetical protein
VVLVPANKYPSKNANTTGAQVLRTHRKLDQSIAPEPYSGDQPVYEVNPSIDTTSRPPPKRPRPRVPVDSLRKVCCNVKRSAVDRQALSPTPPTQFDTPSSVPKEVVTWLYT